MDAKVQRTKPYRVTEFANELGVNRQTIDRAIKAGRIRAFTFNGMKLIPPEEMTRALAGEVTA
jgi:excisionase family DNA binding protein